MKKQHVFYNVTDRTGSSPVDMETFINTSKEEFSEKYKVNVDDIYMLFGKLGGNVPQFKCRPYQDVLYDIAVTHSPRYLINMEIESKDTIFSKMGTTYDEFRVSPDSISKVRKYYRELAVQKKRQPIQLI